MHVVHMDEYRTRDIGVVLTHLLQRWRGGELKSLAVCCKDVHNAEEITFTGGYRADPAHALNAAIKMSRRIQEIQDQTEEKCKD